MPDFNPLLAAFKKQGVALTDEEGERIRQFMEIPIISPAFVLRLVQEHGAASIGEAFLIDGFQEKTDLPYLLHRYKGHFYRKRYPNI